MMDDHDPVATELLLYNRWANLKLIEASAALTPEQLASSIPGTYGNIYDTLRHIIRSEAHYYYLLTGIQLEPLFSWDDHPLLSDVRPYADQVSSAWLDAAGQIIGPNLVREESQGQIYQYKPLTLLIQLVNHGIEHRTNITTIMAQQAIQAPEINGWGYMDANWDRLGA